MRGWSVIGIEVGKLAVLEQQRCRVDAHAGHTAVEPEAEDVLVLLAHPGVRPVEFWLLGREQMEIPLSWRSVPVRRLRPRRPAEDGLPAVRRKLPVRASARSKPKAVAFR